MQFFSLLPMIPAMALLPWKDGIFLIASFGIVCFTAMQPIELWRTKKTGAVEIKMLAVFFSSTVFWVMYAFSIGAWVLQILSSSYLVLVTITIALWFKYRRVEISAQVVTP